MTVNRCVMMRFRKARVAKLVSRNLARDELRSGDQPVLRGTNLLDITLSSPNPH